MQYMADQSSFSRQVCWLPLNRIVPPCSLSPSDSDHALAQLTASIAQHGLMNPITVRETLDHRYVVMAGRRRYFACQLAGFTHVDAVVLPGYADNGDGTALLSRLQTERLHFLEEAQAYQSLLRQYALPKEELARRLACSPATISNKLRLLQLPQEVQAFLVESRLTERHARALLRLPDLERQLQIARQTDREKLPVRDMELLIDSLLRRLPVPPPPKGKTLVLLRDHRLYVNAVRGIVQQMRDYGIQAELSVNQFGDLMEMRIEVSTRCTGRRAES